jgi:hypothetical protein
MKRIGFLLLCALCTWAVYAFAAMSDFRVTAIAREGNDVRVTWQCTGPSNFVLEVSSTLTGTWDTVNSAFVSPSTLTTTNLVDPNGATNSPARFYRVRILVPS